MPTLLRRSSVIQFLTRLGVAIAFLCFVLSSASAGSENEPSIDGKCKWVATGKIENSKRRIHYEARSLNNTWSLHSAGYHALTTISCAKCDDGASITGSLEISTLDVSKLLNSDGQSTWNARQEHLWKSLLQLPKPFLNELRLTPIAQYSALPIELSTFRGQARVFESKQKEGSKQYTKLFQAYQPQLIIAALSDGCASLTVSLFADEKLNDPIQLLRSLKTDLSITKASEARPERKLTNTNRSMPPPLNDADQALERLMPPRQKN